MALARLSHDTPYTQITWVVRREPGEAGPIRRISGDPFPARDRLAESANQLVRSETGHLTYFPGTAVRQIIWHEGLEKFQVTLTGEHAAEIEVDRVIANVGHRPDNQLFAELQVSEDPIRGAQRAGRQKENKCLTGICWPRPSLIFTCLGQRAWDAIRGSRSRRDWSKSANCSRSSATAPISTCIATSADWITGNHE